MASIVDCMITHYEETTVNITAAVANRVAETGVAKYLAYDTTKDSLIYYKSGGAGADLRHMLTLDQNYNSTTRIDNLIITPTGSIGIAAASARIMFTDATHIAIEDGELEFNADTDDFDFILHGSTVSNLFFMDAGNDRIGMGTNVPDCFFHILESSAGAVSAIATTVLCVEGDPPIISLLGPAGMTAGIHFGTPDNNDYAYIVFTNGDDSTGFRSNTVDGAFPSVNISDHGIAIGRGSTKSICALEIAADTSCTGGTDLGYINMEELGTNAAPVDAAAPAADHVVLYCNNDGAGAGGKTQLCCRFATGAVVILGTEP